MAKTPSTAAVARARRGPTLVEVSTAIDLETDSDAVESSQDPVVALGTRLREVRLRSGMSLREVARQLAVSPSFVSQLENGKSQPSVATLYSISQLLGVSIDELFSTEGPSSPSAPTPAPTTVATPVRVPTDKGAARESNATKAVSRGGLGSPANAWPAEVNTSRLSVTRPGSRVRLRMESGVIWEQLAAATGAGLDFMEIIYPPHSSSTTDSRMLQHSGTEFGYLLEGELEFTVGFEVFTLTAGEALSFDSAVPHLLTNRTDVPARGIWFVLHA